mmetsp:Transcript_22861/g.51551  ORF Transcript_22861/g.51551 Transcript_22861/m.51551 type:complete len:269 (+) Transcript_22861:515-1321(+)
MEGRPGRGRGRAVRVAVPPERASSCPSRLRRAAPRREPQAGRGQGRGRQAQGGPRSASSRGRGQGRGRLESRRFTRDGDGHEAGGPYRGAVRGEGTAGGPFGGEAPGGGRGAGAAGGGPLGGEGGGSHPAKRPRAKGGVPQGGAVGLGAAGEGRGQQARNRPGHTRAERRHAREQIPCHELGPYGRRRQPVAPPGRKRRRVTARRLALPGDGVPGERAPLQRWRRVKAWRGGGGLDKAPLPTAHRPAACRGPGPAVSAVISAAAAACS